MIYLNWLKTKIAKDEIKKKNDENAKRAILRTYSKIQESFTAQWARFQKIWTTSIIRNFDFSHIFFCIRHVKFRDKKKFKFKVEF